MISINLLPFHLRPVKRSPLPYIVAGGVLAIVIICIASIWISTYSKTYRVRAELAKNQAEKDSLKDVVAEYEKLMDQKMMLADKISIINEIVNDRIIWSRQLWSINRLTPENFWFTTIAEKEKTFKEAKVVYNEKKKREERKTVPVKRRVLVLGGYAIDGPDGSNDVYPLSFSTVQDVEFSELFKLDVPKVRDTEFQGYKVKSFAFEYKVERGGKD